MNKLAWLWTLGALALAGCTKDEETDTDGGGDETDVPQDTDVEMSLWDELGGEAAVNALLDRFLMHVEENDEVNWFFMNTDTLALKGQLHDQLCELAGGPCTYTGGEMDVVHADMAITTVQFTSLVGNMYQALDDLGVPYSSDPTTNEHPVDAVLVVLGGTAEVIVTDPDGTGVLFNRIGGFTAISETVIPGFLGRVLADPTLAPRFADADAANLGLMLTLQVCEATGGYCVYPGGDMATVHAGMGITLLEFDTLVGHMSDELDESGVSTADRDTIISVLDGMCEDIVENGTTLCD